MDLMDTTGCMSGENIFRFPFLSEYSRLLIVLRSSADVSPIGPENITGGRYSRPKCTP